MSSGVSWYVFWFLARGGVVVERKLTVLAVQILEPMADASARVRTREELAK
jgi:hypothetical protein